MPLQPRRITHDPPTTLAGRLDGIQSHFGITGAEVAQILETSPLTISRWRTGRSSPRQKPLEHLLLIAWLADELSSLYAPEEARIWLYSPHPMLSNKRPVDLISEGRESIQQVIAIINQLKDSAFG